jgi:hypothetical protein
VDSYPPFALSLARPSASFAVPPFGDPLLPFSVTVALVSDDPLRFSTVTVFSSVVTLLSQVLSTRMTQSGHYSEICPHGERLVERTLTREARECIDVVFVLHATMNLECLGRC